MKVNFNLNQANIRNNIKFEGYKPTKSEYGDKEYEFNYVYDDSKYDCYLELYSVAKDKNNNYRIVNILDNIDSSYDNSSNKEHGIKLESGKATKVDLAGDYNIAPDEPFAYHYKLYPKGNHSAAPIYMLDPGNIINQAELTEVSNSLSIDDIDSTPNNKISGEDDMSSAEVLVSIRTGGPIIYTTLIFIIVGILGAGIYLIRRNVFGENALSEDILDEDKLTDDLLKKERR